MADQLHLSPTPKPWAQSLHRPRVTLMFWGCVVGACFWGCLWWVLS
jgi:hypothetical protein